jgi:hypothetical protein
MNEDEIEEDVPLMNQGENSSKQGSDKNSYRDVNYNNNFLVTLSMVGSMGGFLFGYDTGIIAGA